jgi:photosynthetic reaction center cytochrome c subunit
MKRTLIFAALLLLVLGLSAFNLKGIKVFDTSKTDSLQADRKHYVDELRLAIKGRENSPADSVFKNIKLFKGVPAGRLLAIMNMGYSNSLGVSCGHCHDTQHWEADTRAAKDIARQMAAMTATINNQLLKNINGLQSANPVVNCTTCHRGSIKPALNMPMLAGSN